MEPEGLKQLYVRLHRYAGWLDRARTSGTVRADVQALGTAIDASDDPSPLLQTLDADIARLPSGNVQKMLRTAAAQIRRALEDHP